MAARSGGRRVAAGAARVGLALLVALAWFHAALPPSYGPPPRSPFSGPRWHDPYAGFPEATLRMNSHAHSAAWLGVTEGGESPERVIELYLALGFDVPVISNYQGPLPRERFDAAVADARAGGLRRVLASFPAHAESGLARADRDLRAEAPVWLAGYEHGFSLTQQHQTVLGPRGVDWLDYPLLQLDMHMQHVLDRLRARSEFVVLNHATMGAGYSREDLVTLTGADALEVATKKIELADGRALWDAALSAGRRLWGIAADDGHRQDRASHVGKGWIEVGAAGRTTEAVLEALRAGRFYAVWADRTAPTIRVRRAGLDGGRFRIECSEPADRLRVIGQGGSTRAEAAGAASLECEVRDDDTYLRAEVEAGPATLLTNPVFRHDGDPLTRERRPVRALATWVRRVVATLAFAALAVALLRRRRPRGGPGPT